LISEGIVDAEGNRSGPWRDYSSDGTLIAEGNYAANRRPRAWKFYNSAGRLEQAGSTATAVLTDHGAGIIQGVSCFAKRIISGKERRQLYRIYRTEKSLHREPLPTAKETACGK
jgi:hypothetical protein